ncbi:hypothetical protein ACIBSV_06870 [Embleya sp. NPDC050154]|uniref:hypothetical protein n=1 Tax=unclassified Embleya TaxID=2699296 RepID=UPI0037B6818A
MTWLDAAAPPAAESDPPTDAASASARTFAAAGVHNIAWGCHAAIDPQWLFRFADMPPQEHPQIFATLGMVLGLYGMLYLDVALRPEHGFLVAAVGFVGKILGPLGWLWLYASGQWPSASGIILVTNDLIRWLPFACYLRDSWPHWAAQWREPRPPAEQRSPGVPAEDAPPGPSEGGGNARAARSVGWLA